jgi:Bacteriophage HK97-gp10, putative tail-component
MFKIEVDVKGLDEKLDRLPDVVKAALLAEAGVLAGLLLAEVKAKASGDVLKVRTGKYLDSFQEKVKENAKSVVGQVFTKDPRAGILEWGGREPARTIVPRNAKALYFLASSGQVFAAAVNWPGAQIAPHSVLHSTYLEERDEIASRLASAGTNAANDAI